MKDYKYGEPYESVETKNLKYPEAIFSDIDLAEYEKEDLYMLGDILDKYKEKEKARKAIYEALKKEDYFYSEGNSGKSKEYFFNIGLRLEYWGRFGDAVDAYRKAVKIDSNYFEALYRIWIRLRKWGSLNESDKVETEKIYETIRDYVAKAKDSLKDQEMPILNVYENFEKTLENKDSALDYELTSLFFRVGEILYKWGLSRIAEIIFYRLISKNINTAELWLNYGLSLQRQDKFRDAIDAYDQALKIDKSLIKTIVNRIICLYQLKLIVSLKEIIAILKSNYSYYEDCLYALGLYFVGQRKFVESETIFRILLKIDRNNAFAWRYLGISIKYQIENLQERNLEKKSEKYYTRANELFKTSCDNNNLKEFKNLYRQLIILNANDEISWLSLGNIFERLGKLHIAKDIYNIEVTTNQGFGSYTLPGFFELKGFYELDRRKLLEYGD